MRVFYTLVAELIRESKCLQFQHLLLQSLNLNINAFLFLLHFKGDAGPMWNKEHRETVNYCLECETLTFSEC